jgi:hypothetical protein
VPTQGPAARHSPYPRHSPAPALPSSTAGRARGWHPAVHPPCSAPPLPLLSAAQGLTAPLLDSLSSRPWSCLGRAALVLLLRLPADPSPGRRSGGQVRRAPGAGRRSALVVSRHRRHARSRPGGCCSTTAVLWLHSLLRVSEAQRSSDTRVKPLVIGFCGWCGGAAPQAGLPALLAARCLMGIGEVRLSRASCRAGLQGTAQRGPRHPRHDQPCTIARRPNHVS